MKKVLKQLEEYRHRLTRQQFKTLKGQVLSGNTDGALKGLKKILEKENNNVL